MRNTLAGSLPLIQSVDSGDPPCGFAPLSVTKQALGERPSHCLLLTYYAVVKVLSCKHDESQATHPLRGRPLRTE